MNCFQGTKTFKSFLKRFALIAVIQIVGWFAYTYIEEGFPLTDCIFNTEKVHALIQKSENTEKSKEDALKTKTYIGLYTILDGNITTRNFELYHAEFKKYFKVKETKEDVTVGSICKKWYLFTAITLTTVGYGNVVPKTDTGKIVFFPYCLIGVPAMLFFLGFLGKLLSKLFLAIVIKTSHMLSGTRDVTHKELKSFIASFVFMWIWIMLEALNSHWWPGTRLSIVDGVYFMFVSMTTIGYGDITSPMKQPTFEFRLYIGLSVMSGVVNSFLDFYRKISPQRTRENNRRCCCCREPSEVAIVITNEFADNKRRNLRMRKDE